MVGLAGLEPATFRPPDGRATRLRHSPKNYKRRISFLPIRKLKVSHISFPGQC